jgi:hypothetical protein
MRALIVELGHLFVQQVDPELEHEPRSPHTLASIRKNAYGNVENPYWLCRCRIHGLAGSGREHHIDGVQWDVMALAQFAYTPHIIEVLLAFPALDRLSGQLRVSPSESTHQWRILARLPDVEDHGRERTSGPRQVASGPEILERSRDCFVAARSPEPLDPAVQNREPCQHLVGERAAECR